MQKKIFNLRGEQAQKVLQLFKGVATDEGRLPFHDIHRKTLAAIGAHIFQSRVDVDSLASDFASAQGAIGDNELQHEITHMASVLPYLEPESIVAKTEALGRLAAIWGVSDATIKGAMAFAHGRKSLMVLDSFRTNKPELGQGIFALSWGFFKSSLHLDGNKERLDRYEGYRSLPEDSLGRALADYYDDNKFPLPGAVDAPFSNNLRNHDIHHVLAGYDTSPLGELCVYAFDGALSKSDYSAATVGSVAQFQLGYMRYPGINAWHGQFQPDMIYRAAERGHACRVNYLDEAVDFDALKAEPLASVRERFGIEIDGALVCGPQDPWCGSLGPPDEREDPNIAEAGSLTFD